MTAINTAALPIRGTRIVGNALSLGSSFADCLWDVSDAGGNPYNAGVTTTAWLSKPIEHDVVIDGTWVTSTGTPLDLKFYGTNDVNGVVVVALLYAPASSTGSVPVYQMDAPFAKADWGNAATCYVGAIVRARGWRYLKVQAHDATGVGTFTPGATTSKAI